MAITLLPTQSKQKYVLDLLKNQTTIGDTSFVSLSVFMNGLKEINQDELWTRLVLILNELSLSSEISILKDVLKYPMTVDQLQRFIQQMADEGWTLEDLPRRSPKENELYHVIQKVLGNIQDPIVQWNRFEECSFDSVEALDHFYDFAIQKRLERAVSKGLKWIPIESKPAVVQTIRFANNPRSEAQAAVQSIVLSELDYADQSIVCLDPSLMDQVESFLIQYEVPYQKVGHGQPHPVFRFFNDVLLFKTEPTLDHFLVVIHNDIYDLPYKLSLITYVEAFKPKIEDLLVPLDHVSRAFDHPHLEELLSKDQFIGLEKEAEFALANERMALKSLLMENTQDVETILSLCFDFVVAHLDDQDESLSALYSLKEKLENAHFSLLQPLERWVDFVTYQISNLTLNGKGRSGVILTDLQHAMIPGLKRQIWLSCTQNHYPQFPTPSGLFDQDYYSNIQGYDLKERYATHMTQLKRMQSISDEIIYSYAIGSYDGKAQRMPYELEKNLNGVSSSRWDLYEQEVQKGRDKPSLDVDLAQTLYFKEGLKGSISSFEQYFRCPYRYFLNKGLHLKEIEELGFSKITMGKLMHALLEHAVKEKGPYYQDYLKLTLKDSVKPYMEAMSALFPQETDILNLIELKTLEILSLSLEFLKDRDSHTVYQAAQAETEFELDYPLTSGESIHFKGVIDRIDENEDGFVIVDYKSSKMNFTESQFLAGIKLQLPTYIHAMNQGGKKPQGAFYFNLSPEKIELSADPGFDLAREVLKVRRMNGLIFTKDEGLDQDGQHIVGFKLKDKGMGFPRPFSLNALMSELKNLYESLYEGLKQGDLTKRNKDNSCLYCPYKGFCQFKGPITKIEKVSTKESKVLQ